MTRNAFNTTIEIPNTLRDDIIKLAAAEARHLNIPKLSNKSYLLRLIAREKASNGIQ